MRFLPLQSFKVLNALFVLGLFIILCVGGFTYRHITGVTTVSEKLQDTYLFNSNLNAILLNLHTAEISLNDYIVSEDSLLLNTLFSSRKNINKSLTKLQLVSANSAEKQNILQYLRQKIDVKLTLIDQALSLLDNQAKKTKSLVVTLSRSKEMMTEITAMVANLVEKENTKLKEIRQQTNEKLALTPIFLYSLLIFLLLLILTAYLKINRDLSNLKFKNKQLEYFKELTKQSEIVSKHGNWTWNMTQNTYSFSDNLFRLLGERPGAFTPSLESFMSFVHPDDVTFLSERVGFMLENKHFPDTIFRVRHKDGTIKHLRAYGKTLYSQDGDKSLLGTTTDVTEDVENLKIIKERNEELVRNNKELTAFNYVASHDLQEPLRKIQTFISRFSEEDKNALSINGKKYLQKIDESTVRMRALIDDLLQFSRTNKSDNVWELTDLNFLLENAKEELGEVIEDNAVLIQSSKLPTIRVINFQMQQLFINLISNSIKYRKANTSPVIHINYALLHASSLPSVKNLTDELYHCITFKDNGIGFEQVYAEKIFTLFHRLHDKNVYTGTGIGLSICKKIIENHHGFIQAKSNLDEGAEFIIYIPKTGSHT